MLKIFLFLISVLKVVEYVQSQAGGVPLCYCVPTGQQDRDIQDEKCE